MIKLLSFTLMFMGLNAFAAGAPVEDSSTIEKASVRLIKITNPALAIGYSDTPPEDVAEIPAEILESLQHSEDNQLYGLFGIHAQTKDGQDVYAGVATLSNGIGSYHEKNGEILGFATGEFAEVTIFLNGPYRGKGLYAHIRQLLWEHCAPFQGKTHRNWSVKTHGIVESTEPFKGIRGLISLSNVPSLRATLKFGSSLVYIPGIEQWITQYPPKPESERTPREIALHKAAQAIIQESLDSFQAEAATPTNIPSTEAARVAVSKHYYGAGLNLPE